MKLKKNSKKGERTIIMNFFFNKLLPLLVFFVNKSLELTLFKIVLWF